MFQFDILRNIFARLADNLEISNNSINGLVIPFELLKI